MLLNTLYILLGFILLVKGGDFLIDGSVAIAQRARLSTMVIGITVIGFGTSMPELLVSTQAAWVGSSGLAIGNVAGSNIANIALILGLTSLIHPLPSTRLMMRTDIPFMLFAMLLFTLTAYLFGTIERWLGILMVLLLITFITWEIIRSRRHSTTTSPASLPSSSSSSSSSSPSPVSSAATASQPSPSDSSSPLSPASGGSPAATSSQPLPLWRALLLVLISLAAMVWGADLLISGSSAIAMQLGQHFGVEKEQMERIIGLTVVAVGTSLPELFASLMAARKGETDMAVGNIIGSVTFNILCVVGIASAITPIHNAWTPFALDYAVMLFLGLLLWLFLRTHRKIVRYEGIILFLIYCLYIAKTLIL